MKRLKLKDLLSEKMMRVPGGRVGAVETMKDKPPFAVTDTYGKRMNEQEEGDKPGHFGSGENIEVFGYQTKHFDICKSAVLLFKKITPENSNKLAQVYAAKAAKFLDIVFGIEKDVVEEDSAAPEQIETSIDNVALFAYELGCAGANMTPMTDMTRDIAFVKMHMMEIINRKR
jgi:hypothetical protein|tara:strand:+ start:1881 stop:2399 length:519 start_codon:yes stop_codon:yes gene_type:complete